MCSLYSSLPCCSLSTSWDTCTKCDIHDNMLSVTKHIRASLVISLNDGQPAEKNQRHFRFWYALDTVERGPWEQRCHERKFNVSASRLTHLVIRVNLLNLNHPCSFLVNNYPFGVFFILLSCYFQVSNIFNVILFMNSRYHEWAPLDV